MAGLIFMFSNPETMPTRLGLGSAKREARANGFGLIPTASDPMEVELIDPDDPYTVIATLVNSMSRSFQDVPSGIGSGTIEMMNGDAQLPLVNEELALRFRIKGHAAAQMLVEVLTRATRAQGEEAEQSTVIIGRSIAAILEEAVVFPGRGPATLPIEDTRIFNFANEDFDDSGWGPSNAIVFQNNSLYKVGLPARWPSPTAAWIWAPGATQLFAESGTCYFRHEFVVPPDVTQITLFAAIDDEGEVWFDGQQVIDMVGFTEYRAVTLPVTPGTHLIAVKAMNDPKWLTMVTIGGGSGELQYTVVTNDTLWDIAGRFYGNPTMWPVIYGTNQALIDAAAQAAFPDVWDGRWAGHWIFPGQVLTIPGIPDPNGPGIAVYTNAGMILISVMEATEFGVGQTLDLSNNAWKCLPYPANEPGMTPGEVLDILLTEAKNRGCFPSLEWTFNRFVDSAGRPWRQVGDISVRVGDDMATVLSQLAETYVDFSMRPAGLVLDAYDIDTPQSGSVTTYTEEVDITSLTNTRSA